MIDKIIIGIVIPIIAAILGGVCTLIGVIITINKNEKDRKTDVARLKAEHKEEERKRNVPFIKVVAEVIGCDSVIAFVQDINNTVKEYHIIIKDFFIKNISKGIIILHGIEIEGIYYVFCEKGILDIGDTIKVETTRNYVVYFHNYIEHMILHVEDSLGNEYKIPLNCVCNSDIPDAFDNICSVRTRQACLPELIKEEL